MRDMATLVLSVAQDNFEKLRSVCQDLEKSSTQSKEAVKTLLAHLQTCVDRLFVVEEEPDFRGRVQHLMARDNWQAAYYDLMLFVTAELKTAFDRYESANSGGLTYDMYERFVDLLGRCRTWMHQDEVVLISKEDYARRTPVQSSAILHSVGGQRDHEPDAIKKLQDEVRDQPSVMDDFAAAILGFREENVKEQLTTFIFTIASQPYRIGWPHSSNTHQRWNYTAQTGHTFTKC